MADAAPYLCASPLQQGHSSAGIPSVATSWLGQP